MLNENTKKYHKTITQWFKFKYRAISFVRKKHKKAKHISKKERQEYITVHRTITECRYA